MIEELEKEEAQRHHHRQEDLSYAHATRCVTWTVAEDGIQAWAKAFVSPKAVALESSQRSQDRSAKSSACSW